MSLGTNPYIVGRIMLLTINGVCLLLYFLALSRLIERLGTTDWGRLLGMTAGVFGTFLTTFAVVINNHIVAAAFAALLLEAMVRIWFDGDHRWRTFILAGLYSGLLTANELPAGIFSAAATLVLLAVSFRRTLAGYLPAAAAVMLVFLATNEISLHSWKLAQMRRNTTNPAENWYDYSYRRSLRDAAGHIVRDPVTGAVKSRPPIDSYWRNPSGIDRGESSTGKYAFHILLGHHGFFSLTPIFLASLAGLFIWLFSSADNRKRVLALWIAVATIVCIVFYIWGGPDHNYGGVASGFRWLFWITPLWIVLLLPMADMSESRPVLRGILLVLLALSALSAAYPTWNPWTNPWIYDWMAFNHWL
jgi:hypothetical protein